jgi:hypothetical protein
MWCGIMGEPNLLYRISHHVAGLILHRELLFHHLFIGWHVEPSMFVIFRDTGWTGAVCQLSTGMSLRLLCKGVYLCYNNDFSFNYFIIFLLLHISSTLFFDLSLLQLEQLDFPVCNFTWLAFIHGSEVLAENGKLFFSLLRCLCINFTCDFDKKPVTHCELEVEPTSDLCSSCSVFVPWYL